MGAIFAFILTLGTLFTLPTYAGVFGAQDSIKIIRHIPLKDSKGDDLYLGYRTTVVCFFAGIGLIDQGYVLGIKNRPREYYSLTNEEIQRLQSQKILPSPLPKYTIDFIDYVFGYSLWIILAGTAVYAVLKQKSILRKISPKFKPASNLKPTIEMQEYFLKNFPPNKSWRKKS